MDTAIKVEAAIILTILFIAAVGFITFIIANIVSVEASRDETLQMLRSVASGLESTASELEQKARPVATLPGRATLGATKPTARSTMPLHGFLTYQDILERIQALTPEQRQQTATIWDKQQDEFLPVVATMTTDETCMALDPGHFVLSI